MKERPLIDLGMTGYDELFMNDAERREAMLPKIYNVPLSEIDDFPDHPFQVRLDEDMDQLVESVKERGVITPITLRRKKAVGTKSYPATGVERRASWQALQPSRQRSRN